MKEFYFLNPFLEKIILAFLKTKVGLSQIGADQLGNPGFTSLIYGNFGRL
jgi:hypothetical protein